MIDPSLPRNLEFKGDVQFTNDSFIPISDKNYDHAYIVKAKSTDQIAEIKLLTTDNEETMFFFNSEGKIGIKGQTLFYNPTHLVHADTVCSSAQDGKHVWQTNVQSGNFCMKTCAICGRCEATPLP